MEVGMGKAFPMVALLLALLLVPAAGLAQEAQDAPEDVSALPDGPEKWYWQGREALDADDPALARRKFVEVIKWKDAADQRHPIAVKALYWLGRSHQDEPLRELPEDEAEQLMCRTNWDLGLRFYSNAVSIDPFAVDDLLMRQAEIYLRTDRPAQARTILRRIMREHPDEAMQRRAEATLDAANAGRQPEDALAAGREAEKQAAATSDEAQPSWVLDLPAADPPAPATETPAEDTEPPETGTLTLEPLDPMEPAEPLEATEPPETTEAPETAEPPEMLEPVATDVAETADAPPEVVPPEASDEQEPSRTEPITTVPTLPPIADPDPRDETAATELEPAATEDESAETGDLVPAVGEDDAPDATDDANVAAADDTASDASGGVDDATAPAAPAVPVTRKVARCYLRRGMIHVDGALYEDDWRYAPVVKLDDYPWYSPLLGDRQDTQVRVLYDDQFLYVMVRAREKERHAGAAQLHDAPGLSTDERIGLAIRTNLEAQEYYLLEVTPGGGFADHRITYSDDAQPQLTRHGWNCSGAVVVARWSGGETVDGKYLPRLYTIEMALPLASLLNGRMEPAPGDAWGFGAYRVDTKEKAWRRGQPVYALWQSPQTRRPDVQTPGILGVLAFDNYLVIP
jgi:hypothetical protein